MVAPVGVHRKTLRARPGWRLLRSCSASPAAHHPPPALLHRPTVPLERRTKRFPAPADDEPHPITLAVGPDNAHPGESGPVHPDGPHGRPVGLDPKAVVPQRSTLRLVSCRGIAGEKVALQGIAGRSCPLRQDDKERVASRRTKRCDPPVPPMTSPYAQGRVIELQVAGLPTGRCTCPVRDQRSLHDPVEDGVGNR
jgi:hypothetical protein